MSSFDFMSFCANYNSTVQSKAKNPTVEDMTVRPAEHEEEINLDEINLDEIDLSEFGEIEEAPEQKPQQTKGRVSLVFAIDILKSHNYMVAKDPAEKNRWMVSDGLNEVLSGATGRELVNLVKKNGWV